MADAILTLSYNVCLTYLIPPQSLKNFVIPRGSPEFRVKGELLPEFWSLSGRRLQITSHCPATISLAEFCHPHLEMPQPAATSGFCLLAP